MLASMSNIRAVGKTSFQAGHKVVCPESQKSDFLSIIPGRTQVSEGGIHPVFEIFRRYYVYLIVTAFLALLIGTRAQHLVGSIDNPHAWRQSDTAWYAYSFYKDGINILKPSVCWMGGHKTVILEFPFPEVLMALAYEALGHHLYLARLITLIFFAGSAIYLFLIVRKLADSRLAVIATGVYVVLPLSLFYSRAVHIDFFAVFFAHAMFFHLLRALSFPRFRDIFLAVVAGSFAFLVKAPYAFYFMLPLLCVAMQQRCPLRSLIWLGGCLLIPCLLFVWWRSHAATVNAAMPDWSFIPEYFKFTEMGSWYYGPWEARLNIHHWRRLWGRFGNDVTSSVGMWLFITGLAVSLMAAFRGSWRKWLPLWIWFSSVLVYVVIFFNLNLVHDYYQIPFLAVSSVFVALGIDAPRRILRRRLRKTEAIISFVLFGMISFNSITYARDTYFKRDVLREQFGEIIRQSTPDEALVIATPNVGTDCRDPSSLFCARRNGWSIDRHNLSRDLVERLKKVGASHLAVMVNDTDSLEQIKAYGYTIHLYPIDDNWQVLIANLV
ncbi:MAG: glycosyltransferase family 39 protein [Verrucomicrobia bacterium]|nr:glycosyltransferase family 39 protein [Verrucomicrobiota bacterium]MBU1733814.1 glycosyltransferase family 39 protein [Verrucomicrobiota bacterium]MBU1857185.1 glycosyltransferase family 39 protein [Verrucomicrobiota bacterium]